MAEPLAKVDKITIVSTGDGSQGMGSSRVTGDIARMVAQAPALIEGLKGIKIADVLQLMTPMEGVPKNGRAPAIDAPPTVDAGPTDR